MTESEFIKRQARDIDSFACQFKMALQRAWQAGYDEGRRQASMEDPMAKPAPAAPGEEAKG